MAIFDYKLEAYVGRMPDFLKEVTVEYDGATPTITYWDEASLGKAKPTTSQLNALDSQSTTLENNENVRITRRTAYGDVGDQLDEIYKDIDAWKTRIKAIKDGNPKS